MHVYSQFDVNKSVIECKKPMIIVKAYCVSPINNGIVMSSHYLVINSKIEMVR